MFWLSRYIFEGSPHSRRRIFSSVPSSDQDGQRLECFLGRFYGSSFEYCKSFYVPRVFFSFSKAFRSAFLILKLLCCWFGLLSSVRISLPDCINIYGNLSVTFYTWRSSYLLSAYQLQSDLYLLFWSSFFRDLDLFFFFRMSICSGLSDLPPHHALCLFGRFLGSTLLYHSPIALTIDTDFVVRTHIPHSRGLSPACMCLFETFFFV